MYRNVETTVKGFPTKDGAGVSLMRVLGNETVKEFAPILMLDSFDSTNPDDYTAGFPMHPHRGIETISYVYRGAMEHTDSLGNSDTISDGEVQWMTAGSGIMHEEKLPEAERMLGVQLWLNLPASDKMTVPEYYSIKNRDIEEIPFEGGKIRLLAGKYKGIKGYAPKHLGLDYYDIHMKTGSTIELESSRNKSVMIFTLTGTVYVGGVEIQEKTAAKLGEGDVVTIENRGVRHRFCI